MALEPLSLPGTPSETVEGRGQTGGLAREPHRPREERPSHINSHCAKGGDAVATENTMNRMCVKSTQPSTLCGVENEWHPGRHRVLSSLLLR